VIVGAWRLGRQSPAVASGITGLAGARSKESRTGDRCARSGPSSLGAASPCWSELARERIRLPRRSRASSLQHCLIRALRSSGVPVRSGPQAPGPISTQQGRSRRCRGVSVDSDSSTSGVTRACGSR